MRVDLPEQKFPVDLSSRDECGPFGTKNQVDLSSRDEGGPFGTKIFLWTCHHVMRADLLEQKIPTFRNEKMPVDLSSCDEGGPSGTKRFRWTCHHVMRVDLPEQKYSGGHVIT
jgi:hypothetical protein